MSKEIFLLLLFVFVSSYKNDYILTYFEYKDEIKSHLTGTLVYKGEFNPDDYEGINFQNKTSNLLVPIKELTIDISLECDSVLHVKVVDKNNKRWEVPHSISESYKDKVSKCQNTKSLTDIGFHFQEDKTSPFTFYLTSSDSLVYYSTEDTNFLYTDDFISFGGYLTSNDVYGFGERYHKLKLGDGIFTMWPNDTNGIIEDKGDGGYNGYGTQPLALHRTLNGNFLGVIFNNINAQDVLIKSIQPEKVLLEHRTIGGVIDYYMYLGKNVDETLIQMHEIIGHPMLPPFWSLGFHQSRWGYLNTSQIETVMKKFNDFEIPLDTLWGDIDILKDKRIFALNTESFNDLPLLIYEMHQRHLQFVPIVDIGFAQTTKDPYYVKGDKEKAFIRSNYTKTHMVSNVWPGKAVFPDFFSDVGTELWRYAMGEYYKIIKYDGIWIDMNEPDMITIQINVRGEILNDVADFVPEKNQYEYIPYIPGYRPPDGVVNIVSHSMSENAYSELTESDPLLTSYNFKPLLSLLQSKLTNEELAKMGKRPFILSRSTMLGAGKYAFHWLGDNHSTYADMINGINGIFQFQIYGIPMVGDDLCGFMGVSNDKLCARWMALGSFFPFSRNHNFLGVKGQEPFVYGVNSYTYKISYLALRIRYSMLRYYYTQMFLISKGKSGSIFKPTFFEYSSDPLAYNYIDNGILIGNAFYFIPAISEDVKQKVYYPNADLVNVLTDEIEKTFDNTKTGGSEEEIEIGLTDLKLYMKGGYIVPKQETFYPYVSNTYGLRRTMTELLIQPDGVSHIAEGDVIFDNDAVDTLTTNDYLHMKMRFTTDTIEFTKENDFKSEYTYKDQYLSKITFYRLEYLSLENTGIAIIKTVDDHTYNAKVKKISNHKYVIDIKEYKLEIQNMLSVKLEKIKMNGEFLSLLE